MYESFYHFSEKPFTLLPDPGFLYLSDKHRMALTLLEYGLMNQAGFTVISGDIGTGKTTLIRHLLDHMDREHTVGLISNTHRDFGELLQWILLAFNLDHAGLNKVEMYQRLVDFIIDEYAHNRRVVIIVDEAQNMAAETLEELRMLSNINADKDQALQVILVGQRELRDTLRRPDLVQFAQRISVDYHLEPLSEQDVVGYIRHRMEVAGGDPDTFTEAACLAVHRFSNGVPRLINLLCDTALVYGFAEQRNQIDSALVTDVAREKQQGGIFPVYAEAGPAEPVKPEPPVEKRAVDEASQNTLETGTTPTAEPGSKPTEPLKPAPINPASDMSPPEEKSPAAETPVTASEPDTPASTGRPVVVATGSPETAKKQEQPKSVPAIKPVSPPEPEKPEPPQKKLHVALCSVKEGLLGYLSRVLESHGLEVVSSGPLSLSQLDTINPDEIDVLVININEDNTYVPPPLKKRLAKWPGPVYYNDSTATAVSLHQGDAEFGRLLAEQINALAEDAPAPAGAVS
jgi:type II secretory pathway predicted ATPase ExeA